MFFVQYSAVPSAQKKIDSKKLGQVWQITQKGFGNNSDRFGK